MYWIEAGVAPPIGAMAIYQKRKKKKRKQDNPSSLTGHWGTRPHHLYCLKLSEWPEIEMSVQALMARAALPLPSPKVVRVNFCPAQSLVCPFQLHITKI